MSNYILVIKISCSEFFGLNADDWEPVKASKGENKGQHPVIASNGTVYVDRTRAGEDVRVFIRKQREASEK
ncbi:hypothetical protein [Methanosarcina siciliae]|uniref:hypothetical protein n=1 Tax=Methanosarcina siciliae TaxID=38027 RepID=UPI000A803609|nr:hypothetical protein [Methanosarcina siciliae]